MPPTAWTRPDRGLGGRLDSMVGRRRDHLTADARWFADWAVAVNGDDDYWQRRPQGPTRARVIEFERA